MIHLETAETWRTLDNWLLQLLIESNVQVATEMFIEIDTHIVNHFLRQQSSRWICERKQQTIEVERMRDDCFIHTSIIVDETIEWDEKCIREMEFREWMFEIEQTSIMQIMIEFLILNWQAEICEQLFETIQLIK